MPPMYEAMIPLECCCYTSLLAFSGGGINKNLDTFQTFAIDTSYFIKIYLFQTMFVSISIYFLSALR